jgi:hypothetical protein
VPASGIVSAITLSSRAPHFICAAMMRGWTLTISFLNSFAMVYAGIVRVMLVHNRVQQNAGFKSGFDFFLSALNNGTSFLASMVIALHLIDGNDIMRT